MPQETSTLPIRSLRALALGAFLSAAFLAAPISHGDAVAQIVLKETRTNIGPRYSQRDIQRMRESDRRIQQRIAERRAAERRIAEQHRRERERIRNQGPSIRFGASGSRSRNTRHSAAQR